MNKSGLAALYRALTEANDSHISDEMLAQVVDAEMGGEDIETLFSREINHIENCETCASAYSDLMAMLQTAVEELGQGLTDQNLARTAEPANQPEGTVVDVASIWLGKFTLAAKKVGRQVQLYFSEPAGRLAESSPIYGVFEPQDEWSLPTLTLPTSPPSQILCRLTRQSPESCYLKITLQQLNGTPFTNQSIKIQFNGFTKAAETNARGVIKFKSIPIAALPQLIITLTPKE